MSRKINIFIGSAYKSLKIAKRVSSLFNEKEEFNCEIWNENTFSPNDTFLKSLNKASLFYDFGVFIGSKDDEAIIKSKSENVPRDNVVFEYGLFLGRLGNKKTYLLQEEGCKLPTDLSGYTTPRFRRNDTDEAWKKLVDEVAENMKKEIEKKEIQLLPSTSLAIGYFNSFLKQLVECIFAEQGQGTNQDYKDAKVKVIIPNELTEDTSKAAAAFYKKHKLEQGKIENNIRRPFPIRFYKSKANTNNKTTIIDLPTTFNAIRKSINLLLSDTSLGRNQDKAKIEIKELENFKTTLQYLVREDPYCKEIVQVEWMRDYRIE